MCGEGAKVLIGGTAIIVIKRAFSSFPTTRCKNAKMNYAKLSSNVIFGKIQLI